MKLYHLNQIPENRIKSLFGLTPEVLSAVIIKVLPVLEQKRRQRLENNPERKRRFVPNDGRRREVLPLHKLLMTLVYLRHNCSHTVVGQMFDFSADSSENALQFVVTFRFYNLVSFCLFCSKQEFSECLLFFQKLL